MMPIPRHDNPDRATLELLLTSARAADRSFELVSTNRPESVDAFVKAHPPGRNRYSLAVLPDGGNFIDVDL